MSPGSPRSASGVIAIKLPGSRVMCGRRFPAGCESGVRSVRNRCQLRNGKPAYILADLNDLLTSAPLEETELLSAPLIDEPYLANYVAAMV